MCNVPDDRHPDHGRSAVLVNDAAFLSGLQKIETNDGQGSLQEAWRPKYVFNFIQDRYLIPRHFFQQLLIMHQQDIPARVADYQQWR